MLNKIRFVILILAIFGLNNINAQVGIGTTSPATTLQIKGEPSNTLIPDGIQLPVLNLQQLEAKNSNYTINQDGAIVYINAITTSSIPETINILTPGYYYYDATNDIWKGFGNSNSNNYYLGQDIHGGIVFYIYIGNDGLQHGLIVSKTEASNTKWQNTAALVNANRSWDGNYNFNLITNSPAQTWVNTLGSGWYLPSIDELSLLFQNRFHVNKGLNNSGSTLIGYNTYWSSTEISASSAFNFNFNSSVIGTTTKTLTNYVRAIRSF